MTELIFRGKVMPFGGTSGLRLESRIVVGYGGAVGPMVAHLTIAKHQFEVAVSADDSLNLSMVANNVRSAVAHVVDGLGLVDGYAREVALLTIERVDTGENLQWTGFSPGLAGVARANGVGIRDILEASETVPQFDSVLADLRHAVSEPWDAGFYCYRAIESVRSYWAGTSSASGVTKASSWVAMRTALGVDRAAIDSLKHWADPQRHGERLSISGEQQDELIATAAEIVCRFVVHVRQLDGGARPAIPRAD